MIKGYAQPPVDVELFRPTGEEPSGEWLVVSAFAPYKRIDLAIEAPAMAEPDWLRIKLDFEDDPERILAPDYEPHM